MLLVAFSLVFTSASGVAAKIPETGIISLQTEAGTPTAPPTEEFEPATNDQPESPDVETTPETAAPESPTDAATSATVDTTDEAASATQTPALEPWLDWSLDSMPRCEPEVGAAESIASGGTLTLECTSTLWLDGNDIAPGTISIDWELVASTAGDGTIAILPPLATAWISSTDGVARSAISGLDHGLAGDEPAAIQEREIHIAYRVRIERARCDITPREARLEHAVRVSASGAEVVDHSDLADAFRFIPDLRAIPEPAVTFDGPLNFGSVGATAAGPVVSTLTGTLDLTVQGLDRACGDWTLHLNATPLVDEPGRLLADARLVLVAVGERSLPDGGCDLATGCEALELDTGPNASAEQHIVLTIELRVGPETPLGAFGTTIDATLNVRGSNDG
jgi:hypothetical protein